MQTTVEQISRIMKNLRIMTIYDATKDQNNVFEPVVMHSFSNES